MKEKQQKELLLDDGQRNAALCSCSAQYSVRTDPRVSSRQDRNAQDETL